MAHKVLNLSHFYPLVQRVVPPLPRHSLIARPRLRLVDNHAIAAAQARHRARARFWRLALPGLALFWTASAAILADLLL